MPVSEWRIDHSLSATGPHSLSSTGTVLDTLWVSASQDSGRATPLATQLSCTKFTLSINSSAVRSDLTTQSSLSIGKATTESEPLADHIDSSQRLGFCEENISSTGFCLLTCMWRITRLPKCGCM